MEDQTYKVYILHSETLGKYYVGYTSMNIEERISRHLVIIGDLQVTQKIGRWYMLKNTLTKMLQLVRKNRSKNVV